jgi:hypothetical protein
MNWPPRLTFGGLPFDRDYERALTSIFELTKPFVAKIGRKCSNFLNPRGVGSMLKTLAVIGALAVVAPGFAFADGNPPTQPPKDPPTQQTGPSGPANLYVVPPGISNNPNGLPTVPAVLNLGGPGQPTGGSPNPNGVDQGAASP